MAKLLKLRRGTTTQHGSFTGAEGEVTIDTTKDTAVVHDGSTAGGRPLARQDMNNVPAGTIMGTQLENSGVTAGQYGSSSAIPIVTVDAQGLVTAASTTAIDSTTIANGTSNVAVANNGDITATRSGTARLVVGNTGVNVTGDHTVSGGVNVNGNNCKVFGAEGTSAALWLVADQGDDNGDGWRLISNQDDNDLTFSNNVSGSYVDKLTLKNDGNLDVTGGIDVTSGNITLPDNGEVRLGSSGDLQLYHNGSDSYINDTGTGALRLVTDSLQIRNAANNATRLSVASADGQVNIPNNLDVGAGLDVTGNITVTGTVDGVDVAALYSSTNALSNGSGVLANGVTATTQAASDNSTKVATTAYVTTGIANAQAFPSGTKMLFQQTSAPTGWTKITSAVNNKTLRVVSGSVGSGGNVSFTHAFGDRTITANASNTTQGGNISVANTTAGGNVSISSVSTSGTVNSHTLSSNEMPSHQHSVRGNSGANYWGQQNSGGGWHGITNYSYRNANQQYTSGPYTAFNTENTGGGGGHSHGFTGSSHNHTGTLSGSAHTHNASFTGSAHNHSISVTNLDMQVEYLDVIIASKD